jgi:hypothetical protein
MPTEEVRRARSYVIMPRDAYEATYGKALLLTDTMIAQVLDAIQGVEAGTTEGREALDSLWCKLMTLWNEECPSERVKPAA